MGGKIDFVNPIRERWPQGHRITAKRFADAKLTIAEKDLAIALHFPHLVDRSVLQGRQLFRERPRARLISTSRHGHAQGLMRPHVIVTIAPLIKTNLQAFKVAEDPLGQYLHFQTAMKAFVFALGLRMIRPTVTNANPQVQKPHRQRRVLMFEVITPGRPVVHQHALRQAITAKSSGQLLLHGPGLLIGATLQAQRITRVIIEHGQRMTTLAVAQSKVTFEIHLPQLIRSLLFKALVAARHLVKLRRHAPVSLQDRMHSALGHRRTSGSLQTPFDLARAPAILIANRQHLFFYGRGGAARRMLRPPRSISQPRGSGLLVSLTPFVSRLSADPKPLAQFAEIASWLTRQRQKLLSQAHGRTLLPRHVALLKRFSCHCLLCYPCLWTPVTHVSGLNTEVGAEVAHTIRCRRNRAACLNRRRYLLPFQNFLRLTKRHCRMPGSTSTRRYGRT